MDGFTYHNIFETKGIEYIVIIFFLLIMIPFWLLINKKAGIEKTIKKAIGVLSAGILRIPQGLFYSRNHTWTHLEKSGTAKVGLDDFLMHITGEVKLSNMINSGDFIKKGDLLADIEQNGKLLKIYSPLSGEITGINTSLYKSPGILNEDPYGRGWIYKIKPSNWLAEISSYYLAEEAIIWSTRELERFKDFVAISTAKHSPEISLLILQDGGELRNQPLSELPNEVWQDFQILFLN
jgi:glycine cleavage system H protein